MGHNCEVLDQSERKLLLVLARERIKAELEGREPIPPARTPGVMVELGAFVTLHKRDGTSRALRGCIGQIEARDTLYDTVSSVAHSAAFSDYRFPPLSIDELPLIELEISVLSPLQQICEPIEVRPGDGLFICRGDRSGLMLPQVATEQNWDQKTFLSQTCTKAGLPINCWQDGETEISTFTAEVFDEASFGM